MQINYEAIEMNDIYEEEDDDGDPQVVVELLEEIVEYSISDQTPDVTTEGLMIFLEKIFGSTLQEKGHIMVRDKIELYDICHKFVYEFIL